jgi:hypothetical protein
MKKSLVILSFIAIALFSCADWPNWDLVFQRSSVEGSRGWTGGDGGISVRLPPGNGTLWIFGDSYISGWNSTINERVFSATPTPITDVVFGTTIGVQRNTSTADPSSIQFYARDGAGAVSNITTGVVGGRVAFFNHAMLGLTGLPGAFIWPQGGECLSCDDEDNSNDKLALGFSQFQFCDPNVGDPTCVSLCFVPQSPSCTVGIRVLSPIIARVENPRDPVESWQVSSVETGTPGTSWGASFVEEPDGIYVYGAKHPNMVLARTSKENLLNLNAWSFWDGNDWHIGPLPEGQSPAIVARDVGPVFTVDRIARNGITRWVLLYDHPVGDHFIFVRPSDSPKLWSDENAATTRLDLLSMDETLNRTVEAYVQNATCTVTPVNGVMYYGGCGTSYHGMAHDHISFTDSNGIASLVFSYIIPYSPTQTNKDADYYRPRFGFMPLDFISPWCNPAIHQCWKGITNLSYKRNLAAGQEYRNAFDVSHSDTFFSQLNTLSGDTDLYVRFGQPPTLTEYDCRPHLNGEEIESCLLNTNAATSVYVMVKARDSDSSFTLQSSYDGIQGFLF